MERFGKRNKEKTISLELSGLNITLTVGKHLRFTPKTLSDDASYFLASKCLGSIFQMGFKVSHLQIRDSLTEETKIFHTWTDWIENHKNDRKTKAVNLRKTSRTDPAGFSRSKKITFSLPQKVRNNRFNSLYRKLTVATCLHITNHRSHKFISNFISTWLRGRMGRSFGQDNILFTDSLALLNNHHPLTATYASRKVTLSLSKPSLLHS